MPHLEATSSEIERPVLILYATETGNAHDVAERVAREARRRHFQVTLASVDEYPVVSEFIHEIARKFWLKYFSRPTW
jgi:sulfite reductase alpha subunit-like flavoprotein